MNRFLVLGFVVACGSSTTTGDDGGADGATDAPFKDASKLDASVDATDDAAPDDAALGGDGTIAMNKPCDPNDNLCMPGLLCCSEPIKNGDASSEYLCEAPVNGVCPLQP